MMMEQKIVPLRKDMEFLDAFKETKARGGLPSNVLLDDRLVKSSFYEKLKDSLRNYWYWGAWAREMIAYPEKYGVFQKRDFKDYYYNWIIPGKYIPQKVIGKKGLCLVITPKDLQVVNGEVRVIPANVIVQSFPQTDGWYDFNKATRVPIDAQPKSDEYEAKRYLWRRNEQSLRPLVRDDGGVDDRRGVVCYGGPDRAHGVGVVEPQAKLKLDRNQPPSIDETFRTRILPDNKLKLPTRIRVKQGRLVEVNLRTL